MYTYNLSTSLAHNVQEAFRLRMPPKLIQGRGLSPKQILRAVPQRHLRHDDVVLGHRERMDPPGRGAAAAVHSSDHLPLVAPRLHPHYQVSGAHQVRQQRQELLLRHHRVRRVDQTPERVAVLELPQRLQRLRVYHDRPFLSLCETDHSAVSKPHDAGIGVVGERRAREESGELADVGEEGVGFGDLGELPVAELFVGLGGLVGLRLDLAVAGGQTAAVEAELD